MSLPWVSPEMGLPWASPEMSLPWASPEMTFALGEKAQTPVYEYASSVGHIPTRQTFDDINRLLCADYAHARKS